MNGYYKILGVTRDTGQDEIKKAYHRRACQLRLDYVGPESEEAFKELSIAYEALSDPEKRRLYGAGGADALRGGASPFRDVGGFSDFFDTISSGLSSASSRPTPRRRRGADQLIGVNITLKEAVFGTRKTVSSATCIGCKTCHGSMYAEGTQPVICSNCGGSDTATRISSTMFDQMQSHTTYGACGGYGTIISSPCQECAGQGRVHSRRSYPIGIPADVTKGMQIRVPDKAEVGPGGDPQGDPYLEIRELTNEIFVRREDDLHVRATIPMTTATLGTDFMLSTFDGECTVTIPAGTQPDEEIILKELGVGCLQRPRHDNLHIHIEVKVPRELGMHSRELLEELATLRKEGRVEPQRHDHSMFEKLREKFTGQ